MHLDKKLLENLIPLEGWESWKVRPAADPFSEGGYSTQRNQEFFLDITNCIDGIQLYLGRQLPNGRMISIILRDTLNNLPTMLKVAADYIQPEGLSLHDQRTDPPGS